MPAAFIGSVGWTTTLIKMSVADSPFPAHLTDPKVALKNLLSDAPLAYKVVVHELITNFQKKLEEDPDALAREFTKAFNSNEVDKVFNDRMLALVDSTVALERDFANVKKATLTFDLKKYKKYDARSNTYSAIPEFHPDWKDLDQVRVMSSTVRLCLIIGFLAIHRPALGVSKYCRRHPATHQM